MSEECVAVFWDYASCPVPECVGGLEAASSIRQVTRQFGKVVQIQVYVATGCVRASKESKYHSELRSSGVNVTSYESGNAVGTMLADIFLYALDHEAPATIVLVSGNSGFSYGLSILTWRNYNVCSVAGDRNGINAQTAMNLHWQRDVLKLADRSEWSSRVPSPEPDEASLHCSESGSQIPDEDPDEDNVVDDPDVRTSDTDELTRSMMLGNQPTTGTTSNHVGGASGPASKRGTASLIPSQKIQDLGISRSQRGTPDIPDRSSSVPALNARPSSSLSFSSAYTTQVPNTERERVVTSMPNGTKPMGLITLPSVRNNPEPEPAHPIPKVTTPIPAISIRNQPPFEPTPEPARPAESLPEPSHQSSSVTALNPRPPSSLSFSSTYTTQVPNTERERVVTSMPNGTKPMGLITLPSARNNPEPEPAHPIPKVTTPIPASSIRNHPPFEPVHLTEPTPEPARPAEPPPEPSQQLDDPSPVLDTFSIPPRNFAALIELMGTTNGGSARFDNVFLRTRILANDPTTLQRIGVADWNQYIDAAENAGVVRSETGLGPKWIRLNPQFYALLVFLVQQRRKGVEQPLWGQLGSELRKVNPAVYSLVGVKKLHQYLQLASDAGLVTIGSAQYAGSEWVKLR